MNRIYLSLNGPVHALIKGLRQSVDAYVKHIGYYMVSEQCISELISLCCSPCPCDINSLIHDSLPMLSHYFIICKIICFSKVAAISQCGCCDVISHMVQTQRYCTTQESYFTKIILLLTVPQIPHTYLVSTGLGVYLQSQF